MKKGFEIITEKLNKEIDFCNQFTTYNKSRIFKRARYIMLTDRLTWSNALKQSWKESKSSVTKNRAEVSILRNKLLNLFTPESIVYSIGYITESMTKAAEKGINLNR